MRIVMWDQAWMFNKLQETKAEETGRDEVREEIGGRERPSRGKFVGCFKDKVFFKKNFFIFYFVCYASPFIDKTTI